MNEGYFWIFLANSRTLDSSLKEEAKNSLEQLTAAMKKNEIRSAQKRAQAWLSEHPPLKLEHELLQDGKPNP
ncbi:MAG: hypothetical protein ABR923_15300 [Terracidiphilus sp.]